MAATPSQGAGSPVPQPRYSLRATQLPVDTQTSRRSVFSRARQSSGRINAPRSALGPSPILTTSNHSFSHRRHLRVASFFDDKSIGVVRRRPRRGAHARNAANAVVTTTQNPVRQSCRRAIQTPASRRPPLVQSLLLANRSLHCRFYTRRLSLNLSLVSQTISVLLGPMLTNE